LGNIPIEDETTLIKLTTWRLVRDLGERCPTTQEGMLDSECIKWLPPRWRSQKTPKEWCSLFLQGRDATMKKSAGGTWRGLQADYVEEVCQHKLCGTHFFNVKKVNDPPALAGIPVETVAAFNFDGLHFLGENRKILISYGYRELYRWGGSSLQLNLHICPGQIAGSAFMLILGTHQTKHIAALLLDYVHAVSQYLLQDPT
jgi:hypothetical protein